jgi:filamentous hemagglutinin
MDVVSTNSSGDVALTEAKSSASARLTPNQALAHPEIAETGATVVGRGKPPFIGVHKYPRLQLSWLDRLIKRETDNEGVKCRLKKQIE